jgi:hypothetical protein
MRRQEVESDGSVDNAEGARIMNSVVLLRRPRPETLSDQFRSLFDAAYAQVVRTVWFVVHDHAVAEDPCS